MLESRLKRRSTHSELRINDREEEEVVEVDHYQHLSYKNNNNVEECYGVSASSASSAFHHELRGQKVLGVIGFLDFHAFSLITIQ